MCFSADQTTSMATEGAQSGPGVPKGTPKSAQSEEKEIDRHKGEQQIAKLSTRAQIIRKRPIHRRHIAAG